ncbi:VOC family protein [Mycolicibacterium elephantis]|uniref:VOC family protein n=1 Tax=Mycolicibacterium elephantis TaxID=81858 RepID=UPI00069BF3B6|nr:VOC family protein [Mycolicibacterium elephantis]
MLRSNNLVTGLGYVIVTADDVEAWKVFAETTLGLQINISMSDTPSEAYFRMDEWDWRLGVEHGPDKGLSVLGFEVQDRAALTLLYDRLSAAGVPVKRCPGLAARRLVVDAFQAEDPDGNVLEFFYGGRKGPNPFVSPCAARFVTGEQGLGHAVLWVADVTRTEQFYADLLGFRIADQVSLGPTTLYFTSPNSRHHSIAYGSAPGQFGLQHILLEVDEIDTVGRALDRALDSGVPIVATLGRHSNDRMISFYCASPSGLLIEYGCGGRVLSDTNRTTEFYAHVSDWGHRPPDGSNPLAEHSIDS